MRDSTILKAGVAPLAVSLAMLATPAMAQDATDDQSVGVSPAAGADATETAGAIIVTGTRIKQPNLESASPVTVIGAAEVTQTGTTRVEDLVNALPQVFASQGSNISNGASGTATLDLRGLGDERTLVLLNGRRLVPGDPTTSAADINVIPAAMLKRVDVLTGGASSVYGADAVAGVVNFIIDTDFEGFKLDVQSSIYNHKSRNDPSITNALDARGFGYPTGMNTDGASFDATAAFGTSFDDGRGHIMGYFGYRKINPVLQANRDYSACALSASTAAAVEGGANKYTCGGSGTSPTGTLYAYSSTDPRTSDFTSLTYQFGANRTILPGATPYNYAPLNYFQRPDERYTAGVFADYEISEALHPYMEFMFMDDRTVAQIAPSGNFGNTLSLNCDNPLLSPAQKSVVCANENLLVSPYPGDAFFVVGNAAVENQARIDRDIGEPPLGTTPFNFIDQATGATYQRGFAQILRRNVEGGARRDDLQHTSYRAVLGTRGDLGSAWSYDIYYQYGRTNFAETYTNDFSVTRLNRALDVVLGPDGVTPVCRSTLDGTDPNCVPWDIFNPGVTAPSAASIAYLSTPGFQRGINTEQVASGYFSGALGEYGIKSPWANEGIGLVIGAEYRKEKLEFYSDTAFQTGDLSGQGAATLPVEGSFDVKEVFTEVRIPLVQDSWIYDLQITAGYRYSDYNTGNQTDTYKIEGEFAPIRDIRFRGGYNRAVRAPTIQDLFAPQRVVLDGTTDPCAGFAITAADTGCLAQGLTVGQVVAANPAGQYNGLIGGNTSLEPEKADTYTVGVVLQPSFLPGFSASIDYFDISVKEAISGIGADTIVNVCTETADPFFCGLINRDPSGSLWRTSQGYVSNLSQNIGGISTSGIDVAANYTADVLGGRFSASFVGTYLNGSKGYVVDTGVDIPNADQTYSCVGLYGNVCGTPTPKWRHQARFGFDLPSGVGMSVRWRHFDGVTLDALSSNTNLSNTSSNGPAPGGVARPGVAAFPSVDYFDLALTWDVGDHYKFRFGANNVFDKAPPVTGSQACPAGTCNGNVYAQTYDAIGRYLYAGVTLDF
ncbi:TonB-dependent receptor [Tsuneonella suprasediminis]|uniref:TonB-dependent receptor n=1 Tax=Tsuneonella suprasediminis TaxID=2306996 RepID=A0A419R269_9SPHN|nr:TonB-dependent receptor [Tsuneonella suprasediminis]RJX68060.1 TonB-dependent receptor [Tsuneonella suprasediminis]